MLGTVSDQVGPWLCGSAETTITTMTYSHTTNMQNYVHVHVHALRITKMVLLPTCRSIHTGINPLQYNIQYDCKATASQACPRDAQHAPVVHEHH